MEILTKIWQKISEHVGRGGKAVKQDDYGLGRIARLPVEYIDPIYLHFSLTDNLRTSCRKRRKARREETSAKNGHPLSHHCHRYSLS